MDIDRPRIAVIGLGDIATKAYLPALAARRYVDLWICTRDRTRLDAVGDAYGIDRRFTAVGELLADGVEAAFVHVSTSAHVEIVSQLLAAGVATYVDKPLSDNLPDCEQLVALARESHCSLLVGFNRRYAPVYRDSFDAGNSLVILQKHRVEVADTPQRVVFDDFIHVVDTLRFLAPQAELVDVRPVVKDGQLESLLVQLAADGITALGAMNRNGGYTQEVLETHHAGVRRVVDDMAQVHEFRGGHHTVVRRDDWTSVHVQRGFDAICTHFIDAVRKGEVLDPADALRTHEMCARIVTQVEALAKR
ncbi:MAG: Gfo/Idh/MocA family protein [Acidothermaceae bacterium]